MNLQIRIPGWCRNEPVPGDLYRYMNADEARVRVLVNGKISEYPVDSGFIALRRLWRADDVVELALPMGIRRVVAHDSVTANRDRVALERGPLVYCAEWADQPGGTVMNLVLPDTSALSVESRPDMLGGTRIITGAALSTRMSRDGRMMLTDPTMFVAIPYYGWAHRGRGEMAVWLPRTPAAAEPLGGSLLSANSAVTSSGGTGEGAVQDNVTPAHSRDAAAGFWRSTVADTVWLQYEFPGPREVSAMDLYWYAGSDSCPLPRTWRVLLRYEGRWTAAYNPDGRWGVEPDTFNRITFEAFKTDAVRLEVVPQEGSAAGVLEWRVY
jgi:hypothetical protein